MELPSDFESSLEAYPIRLSNFEGPLDLLIHLIKKNRWVKDCVAGKHPA